MRISDSHTDLNNPALKKPTESPFVAFLDSFLQEKNIKWVLTAGMMILLGSSLMMVTRGWSELDEAWQYVVIIGYTATIFGAGSWSYHRLGLRRTGTGLLALSVLLIPLSFVAWNLIWDASTSAASGGIAVGLLLVNTIVAAYASRRIFAHFLQGHQVTFVMSYLALSLAGAVAPLLSEVSDVWSWFGSAALWCMFTAGVVKVNRHVFWLTEEHRKPRIIAFFPILLLGGQFLLVFGLNFAEAIPHDWFGLACVLVAIPVLLTADAVADVFQQRTGNLVRPIPWPIMLPIVSGVLLCAVGVLLALSGLVTSVPYAVVPTAALAAILMTVVAKRTNQAAFVWAMLGCSTLAYNFSPAFFQEFIFMVRDAGANALGESRLPFAFYGLTYLPLIGATVVVANQMQQRSHSLFAIPMQRYSIGISIFLLAVAVTHSKAIFPVAGLMTAMFAWQATVFRRRSIVMFGMVAFLIASTGLVPFASVALDVSFGSEMFHVFTTIAAAALLVASRPLTAWINRLPVEPSQGSSSAILDEMPRAVSLVATIGIAVVWLTQILVPAGSSSLPIGIFIFALLAAQSLVWSRPAVSWIVYGLVALELLRLGVAADLTFDTLTSLAIVTFGTQWFVGYAFGRFHNHRIATAWADVNHVSAFIGLLFATLFFALPNMVQELLGNSGSSVEALRWVRDMLLVVWCFDAARKPQRIADRVDSRFRWERRAQPIPAFLGSICVLGLVGCGLVRLGGNDTVEWLPLAWTLTAAAAIPLVQHLRHKLVHLAAREDKWPDYFAIRAMARPIDILMMAILVIISTLQLFVYSTSLCVAGYVGLAGLLALTFLRQKTILRTVTAAVINWTFVLTIARLGTPYADNFLELLNSYRADSLWWVSVASSISLLLWQRNFTSDRASRDIALTQRTTLRLASSGALLLTIGESSLSVTELVAAVATFSILFASELRAALQTRIVARVWIAEAVVVAGCTYLLWFGVISLEQELGMFAPLGLGFVAHIGGAVCSRREDMAFLSQPLLATGRWLPLVAVGIGTTRHIDVGDSGGWLGMNSLAILAAGGFYFWQAIERKSKGFAVLAAAILNVAIMLLWSELRLADPQFYLIPIGITILLLVEVLKREIPTTWHNPLRYAGALTILVSPTFHIVDQTWVHLIALMVLATTVLLISIGLRLRALMYTGAAFLIADLVAMVICGGIDHPNLLWLAGIGFGAAIITLGAICENNRERLLQRMRVVSARMEQWQ
ncbi:MAG: hypothetical protein H8E66_05195 [Planctomycetes bacterium]|nr:hypothetical protein [Planctomycetota bacterium]